MILATNEDLIQSGRCRYVSSGPLLSRQCDQHRASSTTRTSGRHSLVGGPLLREVSEACDREVMGFDSGHGGAAKLCLAGQRSTTGERGGASGVAGSRSGADHGGLASGIDRSKPATVRPPARHSAGATPPSIGDVSGKTLARCTGGTERQIILQALRSHSWNRAATADALDINRTTLYKKMKRLGLDDPRLQFA